MVRIVSLLGALALVLLTSDLSVRYPMYGWTLGMVCAVLIKPMLDVVRGSKTRDTQWYLARAYLRIAFTFNVYTKAESLVILIRKDCNSQGIINHDQARVLLNLNDKEEL